MDNFIFMTRDFALNLKIKKKLSLRFFFFFFLNKKLIFQIIP